MAKIQPTTDKKNVIIDIDTFQLIWVLAVASSEKITAPQTYVQSSALQELRNRLDETGWGASKLIKEINDERRAAKRAKAKLIK